MIEAHCLVKRYGDVEALRGVSFSIEPGSIVGLLGPNGAGKTTAMRILTTYLPPTEGTATVAGFDILKESEEVRKHIGYLPETPPLYPDMRVEEFLTFVAKIKGVPGSKVKSAVDDALERCSLGDVRKRLCSQLSKGFRQRVGLAHAIAHNPKIIILDEPTSGLDPAQIIEIRNLISSLAGEHTVILSTHILAEVSQICSDVVIISKGVIAAAGSLEELTAEVTLEERFLDVVAKDAPENGNTQGQN